MHVDPKLFALVFGESILNDAVAIVLFESLLVFQTEPVTAGSVFAALGSFIGVFFGSFAIGMVLGCLSALVRPSVTPARAAARSRALTCQSARLPRCPRDAVAGFQTLVSVPLPQL